MFSATSFLAGCWKADLEDKGEDRDREAGTAVRARWIATLGRGSDCGTGASLYSGTGGGRMRPRLDEGGTERDMIGGVGSELR